jgi:hypothetical protein
MTKDDIVGWWKDGKLYNQPPAGVCYAVCLQVEAERQQMQAVAAERERCARLCEDIGNGFGEPAIGAALAAAIRWRR